MVPWDAVMTGAAWFHVTGITPALGEKPAAAGRAAIEAAKRAGARVSVDLNYRKKLWSETGGAGDHAVRSCRSSTS